MHRRMVGRESHRGRVRRDIFQPNQLGVVDQHPEHSPAFRQVPDQLGVDEIDRGVHDGAQRVVEFQAAKPVAAPDDPLHPVLHLGEQLTQPQLDKVPRSAPTPPSVHHGVRRSVMWLRTIDPGPRRVGRAVWT